MLDLGKAVMEDRRSDRRFAALEDYLRKEYGSASGMERYLAVANHTPAPRSSLRTFLAKIAGAVVRPRVRGATPAVSVDEGLSDDGTERLTALAPVTPVAAARPVGYRKGLNVRPRTVRSPLRR